MNFKLYRRELEYMKPYILATIIAGVVLYSGYVIFDSETILRLTREDNVFE